MSEHQVLVMGLPKTGKTTFLAALWDVVEAEKVSGSLVLEGVEGNQQHLNEIRDKWADCCVLPRTSIGNEKIVSMTLVDKKFGIKGRISFPDMDGEAFERQWAERSWQRSHKEITENSISALIFIHPKVKKGSLIRDTKRVIADLAPGAVAPKQEPPIVPADGKKFTPTQVQLVELLQFVQWVKKGLSGFRLGIIVSAWDVVMKQETKTPDKWLEFHLPMLHQYLVANRESISTRVYGVSAQGGDIEKEAVMLRKKRTPSERIIVVEGEKKTSDITTPVRWVMGMTES